MDKLENEFIRELESEIREWESLATYFDGVKGDVTIQGLGTVSNAEMARRYRAKAQNWRELIDRIKKAN